MKVRNKSSKLYDLVVNLLMPVTLLDNTVILQETKGKIVHNLRIRINELFYLYAKRIAILHHIIYKKNEDIKFYKNRAERIDKDRVDSIKRYNRLVERMNDIDYSYWEDLAERDDYILTLAVHSLYSANEKEHDIGEIITRMYSMEEIMEKKIKEKLSLGCSEKLWIKKFHPEWNDK